MSFMPTAFSQANPLVPMEVVELKVRLHCKACEKSARRALHKLKGVTCVEIDVISNKMTVLGYIDKHTVIKAIQKTGRPASEWSYCRPCQGHSSYRSPLRCSTGKIRRLVLSSDALRIKISREDTRFPKRKFSDKILKAMCFKGKW